MNFHHGLSAALIGVTATIVIAQPPAVYAMSADQVGQIAKSITVLIDSKEPGSGVIVKKEGNTYTVLSARHVFKDPQAKYEIVTPDGSRYALNYSSVKKLPSVDLAVVEFTTSKSYTVAKIGNSDLATEGKAAYVAGFPKTSAAINTSIYNFTDGRITANASRPLEDGYSLVYSNNTLPGMSGGPVLNENGEVVGIHGRADTRPVESSSINQNILIAKTGFNLGIPINTSLRLLASARVDLGVKVPSAPVATGPKADDFYIQGNEKYNKGDYQGALVAYNQAIQLNPNYAKAYSNRGLARYQSGDKQRAIQDYNQALKINPNDVPAYYNRGNARSGLGDKQGAIADYNRALEINPNLADTYLNRGMFRFILKDYQGAIADYNRALRINPNYSYAYFLRGNARADSEAYQVAIQDYQKAADLFQQEGDKGKYQYTLKMIQVVRDLERNAPNRPTSNTLLSIYYSLIPGKSSVLRSDGTMYELHTFEGKAGQSVTINLESRNFNTFLILLNSDLKVLAENDNISPSNTNSVLTVTLPASGLYVVVVNAQKKGEAGQYTLTVR